MTTFRLLHGDCREVLRSLPQRVAALEADRDALQVVRDQMADGIMRCIDASWSGTRSMDWTHPELILAEYVGDMQATLTRLQQERDGLIALAAYAEHTRDCAWRDNICGSEPCSCGLYELPCLHEITTPTETQEPTQ